MEYYNKMVLTTGNAFIIGYLYGEPIYYGNEEAKKDPAFISIIPKRRCAYCNNTEEDGCGCGKEEYVYDTVY